MVTFDIEKAVSHIPADLLTNTPYLLVIIAILAVSYLATYSSEVRERYFPENKYVNAVRFHLLSYILLCITTLVYWIIDTHLFDLPNPVLPYVFYILIFTILFGWRSAILLFIFSIGLIVYYLYEPRYTFDIPLHELDLVFTTLGLLVGLIVGQAIRRYQEKLLLNRMNLQNLISARDRFASVAAHEMKTPLTTIKLYTQMLMKKYSTNGKQKKLQDAVTTIDRESDKLLRMVNEMLDFSKLQSGKFAVKKESVDIVNLTRERVEVIQKLYGSHKFVFRSRIRKCMITGDPISLDRIFTNLLSNAAKYSPEGTTIETTIRKNDKSLTITVKDKGMGIDKKQQALLFEPFYQAGDSKKGLGLGLFIVKALVDLHKGKITVTSVTGKGSTFTVSLPIETK